MNSKTITLSVLVASALAFNACSSSSGGDAPVTLASAKAEANATTASAITALTDAAAKGTVVTIADGYAVGCKVKSGPLTAQEVTSTIGQYLFLGDPAAHLSATGCTDKHTGVALPPLSAPAPTGTDGLDSVNVTPITTITQSFVAGGKNLADAKVATTELTGVAATDLEKDPVATPAIQKAVAKVVAIAKLTTSSTNTNPIDAITQAANTAGTGATLVSAATTVDAASADAAVAVENAIESAVAGDTLQDAVAKIVKVASTPTAKTGLTNETAINTATSTATLDTAGTTTNTVTADTIATVSNSIVKKIVEDVKAGKIVITSISSAAAVVNSANAAKKAKETLDIAQNKATGTGGN